MVDITNWSTPTISAEVPNDITLKNIKEISFKIEISSELSIEKLYSNGGVGIDGQMLYIPLTQEETAKLKGSPILQVNLYFIDGTRLVSNQTRLNILPNIKGEVMT